MSYRTILVVDTAEPVSADHLAQRVAEACGAYGALRPGEKVSALADPPHTVVKWPRDVGWPPGTMG